MAVLLLLLACLSSAEEKKWPKLNAPPTGQSWYQGGGAGTSAGLQAPQPAQQPQAAVPSSATPPPQAPAPSPEPAPEPRKKLKPRAVSSGRPQAMGPPVDAFASRDATPKQDESQFKVPLTPFDQVAKADLKPGRGGDDKSGNKKSDCVCRKGFACKCPDGNGLILVNGQWGCCPVGTWYHSASSGCSRTERGCAYNSNLANPQCYEVTPDP